MEDLLEDSAHKPTIIHAAMDAYPSHHQHLPPQHGAGGLLMEDLLEDSALGTDAAGPARAGLGRAAAAVAAAEGAP
jgi:hypothetical protein